jgi:hypothetical protein
MLLEYEQACIELMHHPLKTQVLLSLNHSMVPVSSTPSEENKRFAFASTNQKTAETTKTVVPELPEKNTTEDTRLILKRTNV